MIWPYWLQLNRKIITTSHSSIDFDKFAIFVEWHSWTLFATSNKSSQHYTICTYSQSFTHVSWIFISSIRDERNVIIRTHWCSIHKSRELRYSASCNNSSNTNTSISYSTSNTVSTTSDQVLSSLACSYWAGNNIDCWELLFQLLSSIQCQFGVSICDINY